MRLFKSLPISMVCFLKEESGTSLMELALLGLLVVVVGTLVFLAFGKNA